MFSALYAELNLSIGKRLITVYFYFMFNRKPFTNAKTMKMDNGYGYL